MLQELFIPYCTNGTSIMNPFTIPALILNEKSNCWLSIVCLNLSCNFIVIDFGKFITFPLNV